MSSRGRARVALQMCITRGLSLALFLSFSFSRSLYRSLALCECMANAPAVHTERPLYSSTRYTLRVHVYHVLYAVDVGQWRRAQGRCYLIIAPSLPNRYATNKGRDERRGIIGERANSRSRYRSCVYRNVFDISPRRVTSATSTKAIFRTIPRGTIKNAINIDVRRSDAVFRDSRHAIVESRSPRIIINRREFRRFSEEEVIEGRRDIPTPVRCTL